MTRSGARTLYVHVNQSTYPAAFAQIEQEWLLLRKERPCDPELAQGLLLSDHVR